MILGYHIVFGAYGFWLPNDPRGSWSEFVGAWELLRYGIATTTTETRSLADRSHDNELRQAAKQSLKYPPVHFSGIQARAVGRGFAKYATEANLPIWACAILPDHVHLVIGRFRLDVEKVVIQLKAKATRQLMEEQLHPFAAIRESGGRHPKCFARGEWKVFLDSVEAIQRAITYVVGNPRKEGKPEQKWSCVTPFTLDALAALTRTV